MHSFCRRCGTPLIYERNLRLDIARDEGVVGKAAHAGVQRRRRNDRSAKVVAVGMATVVTRISAGTEASWANPLPMGNSRPDHLGSANMPGDMANCVRELTCPPNGPRTSCIVVKKKKTRPHSSPPATP